MTMTEQDLIDLGFEREEPSYENINVEGIFQNIESPTFYTLVIGEIELQSNREDEWEDELEVEVVDTSIVFNDLEDLRLLVEILRRNEK